MAGCSGDGSWGARSPVQAHSEVWPLVGGNSTSWDPGRWLHLRREVQVRCLSSDIFLMTP